MSQASELNPVEEFNDGLEKVRSLLSFDEEVLSVSIEHLENLVRPWSISRQPEIKAKAQGLQAVIQTLKNSRNEGRLKPKFQIIANQGVVLLVSYFSAALFNLFRRNVVWSLIVGLANEQSQDFEVKVQAKRLSQTMDRLEIGGLIAEKQGYSFQNMEDICKAFESHFGVALRDKDLPKNSPIIITRNNVQLALACRNVIVHQGTVIDEKFIRQLKNANPRTLLSKIKKQEAVNFTFAEVNVVAEEMKKLLEYISTDLQNRLKLQEEAYKAFLFS